MRSLLKYSPNKISKTAPSDFAATRRRRQVLRSFVTSTRNVLRGLFFFIRHFAPLRIVPKQSRILFARRISMAGAVLGCPGTALGRQIKGAKGKFVKQNSRMQNPSVTTISTEQRIAVYFMCFTQDRVKTHRSVTAQLSTVGLFSQLRGRQTGVASELAKQIRWICWFI